MVTTEQNTNLAEFGPALGRIRRKRWYLWSVILVYLPAMMTTLKFTSSIHALATVFMVWFVLLFSVAMVVCLARCPRCGNHFHMHGMTFLTLRRCLHCQLHINADKGR